VPVVGGRWWGWNGGDVHYTGCNNGGRKHWQSGRNVATAVTAQAA